jgi:hypothetical protein
MAQQQPATRNLGRLSEIAQVMVRHGFGYFLAARIFETCSTSSARPS